MKHFKYNPSFYRTLGLDKTATEIMIKKAYKTLAIHFHPDKNQENIHWANEKFQELSTAYEVLSSPTTKKDYDVLLTQFENQQKEKERKAADAKKRQARPVAKPKVVKVKRNSEHDLYLEILKDLRESMAEFKKSQKEWYNKM